MTRFASALLALATMTACSQAGRSESYFEAHPADAQAVLAGCRSGRTRGEECRSALAGATAAANHARLDLYRKSF